MRQIEMGWSRKNIKAVALIILAWLMAIALVYVVIIKLRLLFR